VQRAKSLLHGEGLAGSDLVNPTGLAIRDGCLYVSDFGHGTGQGEVVRITAVPEPETWAPLALGLGAIGFVRGRREARC